MVYAELHRIAQRNLVRENGEIWQPSALVNEAFIRLMGGAPVDWASRAHFFGFSARLMSQILIDFARRQDAEKRGGRAPEQMDLAGCDIPAGESSPVNLLDLDQALNQLAALDARQAEVVVLRYFGGLNNSEIAETLGISEPTVVRDWRLARAWLYRRLESPNAGTSPAQA